MVNIIFDKCIRKEKSPFAHLAVVSLVQTIIALDIYFIF